jgi:hypothetical protein
MVTALAALTALALTTAPAPIARAPERWPSGVYEAHVAIPLLPRQSVRVTTPAHFGARKGTGLIYLKGVVTVDDEPFRFTFLRHAWHAEFRARVTGALQRFHCEIILFDYDPVVDAATVTLRMPLVGVRKIVLRQRLS